MLQNYHHTTDATTNSIERIDFHYQMAFANAAEARVAAHLADRVDALRHERRAETHASRGRGCLAARVSSADDDDAEVRRSTGEWGLAVVARER